VTIKTQGNRVRRESSRRRARPHPGHASAGLDSDLVAFMTAAVSEDRKVSQVQLSGERSKRTAAREARAALPELRRAIEHVSSPRVTPRGKPRVARGRPKARADGRLWRAPHRGSASRDRRRAVANIQSVFTSRSSMPTRRRRRARRRHGSARSKNHPAAVAGLKPGPVVPRGRQEGGDRRAGLENDRSSHGQAIT